MSERHGWFLRGWGGSKRVESSASVCCERTGKMFAQRIICLNTNYLISLLHKNFSVTFGVALIVPSLGLLISLIGAVCSNSLALLFPVIIEFLNETRDGKRMSLLPALKNGFVLLLFIIGFASGAFESVKQIIDMYQD